MFSSAEHIRGTTMRTRRDWMRWGALAILSAVTSQHVGAAPSCADLAKPGLFPNAVVQTATVVAADAKTGMPANDGSDIRLFTLPGVYHCGGGPGADSFDPLAGLERWVEHGEAPETMVATNRTTGIERPVCAWPK